MYCTIPEMLDGRRILFREVPMPLYDYKCCKCGLRFERIRPVEFRDQPLDCPECEGPTRKMPTAPVLQDNLGTKLRGKLDRKKSKYKEG
jgi:putative FmdB family regulatory protein